MTAITLELPDDLAAHLAALPDAERSAFATAALSEALAEDADDLGEGSDELTTDDLAAIGAGLAAMDAGHVTPGPVAFAEMDAHLAELKRAKQQHTDPARIIEQQQVQEQAEQRGETAAVAV